MSSTIYHPDFYINFKEGKVINKKSGKEVGYYNKNGYRVFRYKNKQYLVHRFLMEMFIKRPLEKGEYIDHINHKRNDNRIENLRILTNQQNMQNRKCNNKNNKLGVLGISIKPNCNKKYVAEIRKDGKFIYHKYFYTLEEAVIGRNEKVKELK